MNAPTPSTLAPASLPSVGPPSSRDPHAAEFKRLNSLRYMQVLEREYLTCRWRHLHYPRPKDRSFHGRVAGLKEGMIRQIAVKLQVPCLFTDDAYRAEVEGAMDLVPGSGYPLLHYKDHVDRAAFEALDQRAYFRPGTDVRLQHEDRTRTARILNLMLPGPEVRIRIDHGPTLVVNPLLQPELAFVRL